jgi:hypothetical protein
MNDQEILSEVSGFYKRYVFEWMLKDLQTSISNNTNYLSALGCFVYTEVFGNLLPPLGTEKGLSKYSKPFFRSLFRFKSSKYLEELNEAIIKISHKNIYDHLRSGASHRYFPLILIFDNKKNANAVLPFKIVKDGYSLDRYSKADKTAPPIFISDDGYIGMATQNFLNEFTNLIQESYSKTFEEKNSSYIESAIKGFKYIIGISHHS